MFLNEVNLVGRLTRKPELVYTEKGTTVCSGGLAISGPKDQETSFVDIVSFKQTAERLAQWCEKGDELMIRGKLQQDRWQDKSGNNRQKIKVIVFSFMLSHKPKRPKNSLSETDDSVQEQQQPGETEKQTDLPF